jgi:hypothetical protein
MYTRNIHEKTPSWKEKKKKEQENYDKQSPEEKQ